MAALQKLRPIAMPLWRSIGARSISTTVPRLQQPPDNADEAFSSLEGIGESPLGALSRTIDSTFTHNSRPGSMLSTFDGRAEEPHHLHIYSTKHNTHITFTNPNKDPIISLSCGNIGFRKSHRGTYDAAYQLASKVFRTLEERKIHPKSVEVLLRGFGQGREAVMKALLGHEGRMLKHAVCRVTDSTRLKFGGTRSKKPRRLG